MDSRYKDLTPLLLPKSAIIEEGQVYWLAWVSSHCSNRAIHSHEHRATYLTPESKDFLLDFVEIYSWPLFGCLQRRQKHIGHCFLLLTCLYYVFLPASLCHHCKPTVFSFLGTLGYSDTVSWYKKALVFIYFFMVYLLCVFCLNKSEVSFFF